VYFEYDLREKNQCYWNIAKWEVFREVDLAVWLFFFIQGLLWLLVLLANFLTLSSFYFSNCYFQRIISNLKYCFQVDLAGLLDWFCYCWMSINFCVLPDSCVAVLYLRIWRKLCACCWHLLFFSFWRITVKIPRFCFLDVILFVCF
jgi:hypothetical protein